MTLLTIITRAARRCGLSAPSTVLGSGDETYLQLAEYAQETLEELTERHDWKILHKTQTITGDGSSTTFALNSDFSRLSKMPGVTRTGSTSGFWPAGPLSPPAFLGAQALPVSTVRPLFDIVNGITASMIFVNAPATSEVYVVSYQSENGIYSVGSGTPTNIATWTYDSDVPFVPERLVMLGTICKWKASKGLSYAEFMSDYERSFEKLASDDWGLMPVDMANVDYTADFQLQEPRVNV